MRRILLAVLFAAGICADTQAQIQVPVPRRDNSLAAYADAMNAEGRQAFGEFARFGPYYDFWRDPKQNRTQHGLDFFVIVPAAMPAKRLETLRESLRLDYCASSQRIMRYARENNVRVRSGLNEIDGRFLGFVEMRPCRGRMFQLLTFERG